MVAVSMANERKNRNITHQDFNTKQEEQEAMKKEL